MPPSPVPIDLNASQVNARAFEETACKLSTSLTDMKFAFLFLASLAGLPLSFGKGVAMAQSTQDVSRAKKLMLDGGQYLELQEFAGALERFDEAMRLVPNSKIEFGIGLAREGLGQKGLAYEAFSRYLAGPDDENIERWRQASKHQAALRDQVVFVEVKLNNPHASLVVDGGPVMVLPLARPLVLEAGQHTIQVEAEGLIWKEAVPGVAGGKYVLTPNFQPKTPIKDLSPSANGKDSFSDLSQTPTVTQNRSVWLWPAVGLVLAGVVATAILLSSGTSTQHACAPGIECINAK